MASTIAIKAQALRSDSGTQDWTVSGFGTPVAYIVDAYGAATDGTPSDHARFSRGFCDGTRQYVAAVCWEHGVADTANCRRAATDEVLMLLDTTDGTVAVEASHNSFITDGVRLDVVQTDSVQWFAVVTLFKDVTAYVEYVTHTATVGNTQDFTNSSITDIDAIFFAATNDGVADTVDEGRATCSLGIGSNESPVKASCVATLGRSGQTSGEAISMHYQDGHVVISPATTGIFGSLDTLVFITNGFRLTKRDNDADRGFGYLALKFNGVSHKWNALADPASTGSDAQTWCGFKPQAILGLVSCNDAFDATDTTEATGAGSIPQTFGVAGSEEHCGGAVDEDGSPTTDAQSHYKSTVIEAKFGDGPTEAEATHTTFDANGYTWNWATVGQVQMSMLAIQEVSAGGLGIPIAMYHYQHHIGA